MLEACSDETHWSAVEGALNHPTLRVYDLKPACLRWEGTTAHGHGTVTADGWCQCGQRTDHRPDLPQVKVMLAALALLGMPVAPDVGPGPRADDPLSVPAISRVREGLGPRGQASSP